MKNKVVFVFILFIFLFSSVIVKTFYISVLNRDKLISYSKSQIVREVKVYPRRGQILDRNGHPLAINIQKYNLFTFARDLSQLKKDLNTLDTILGNINVSQVYQQAKERKKFTWILRNTEIDEDKVEKLRDLKEIVVEVKPSRTYPNNELMSQVLGFVGVDNEGLSGIEYFFNEELKGEAKIHRYLKDAKGRAFKSVFIEGKSKDITLSIDKDIQSDLEDYLKEGVEKYSADKGGAAVMDVETGEILAMANYPTYDPNQIKSKDKHNIKLSFVTDPFEPGSIFKTLTIASALDHKVVKLDTNYYCELGQLKVGNHIINESDSNHKFEWLSVEDILKYSSNVGTTKIAFDLTYPNLKKTLNDFNIGKKTGIEFKGESRGIIDDSLNISPLRLSNISFGQGVASTGIQMLAAYAAIANGGYYVSPTFLKQKNKPNKRKILPKSVTSNVEQMLVKAVSEGTGSNAKIRHFEIAGKTGTAQRVDGKGGYSGYVAGFIGYPVNVERRFVVFAYVDNPKKDYYGNVVAAPIFQKITKNILYKRKEYKALAINGLKDQERDKINIRSSSARKYAKGEIPNLLGYDKKSAIELLDKMNVKYNMSGFGVVNKQSISPGTKITSDMIISLDFKAPRYE